MSGGQGSGTGNEVNEPILNRPFYEPELFWYLREGETPQKREGRRPSFVFEPRDQRTLWTTDGRILGPSALYTGAYELVMVNLIRERLKAWENSGYAGATRTTTELLAYWQDEGREKRLFYAQLEAAKTIIFLTEARQDLLQGIAVPRDEPSADRKEAGYSGFLRYACKMATGAGKTTVMGMLTAWSILNKVASRGDKRFSDVVVAVCPNVTIRDRLTELQPERGDASVYRTRDLVPERLMPQLAQGRVLVTNWHVFEPQSVQTDGAKVEKRGVLVRTREAIRIGPKTTTARNKRYLTLEEYERQVSRGLLTVLDAETDPKTGALKQVFVESARYVESDTALLQRVLGRDIGGKKNILVLNDEAHHAYRIAEEEPDEDDLEFGDEEDADDELIGDKKEATVWVEGLDRIQRMRGINFCVDLSATPYFVGRVGQETNKPFPWVVSDFGLIDAIESGLVKVPQLAARDNTGAEIAGYRNIWEWIMQPGRLTARERGGTRANPQPEAVLKWAQQPITMLGSLWQKEFEEWKGESREAKQGREPVYILVVKNTKLAKVIHEWIAEDKTPAGLPAARLEELRNRDGRNVTIRVDSKVVKESDGGAKGDEQRWMRFTLDTVGKTDWTRDRQGQPIYPEKFVETAEKLKRPLHPPGRDVRCIVSVGMLTEGWDCNTVTHIIGLRPFMSQLLCEQVVGRGLRRASYELGPDDRFSEEIATVLGVPFEVVPFKANTQTAPDTKVKRHHVHALPERSALKITFPRVEGYTQAIRNRIVFDWDNVPPLLIDPLHIPTEIEMRGLNVTATGWPVLNCPGTASKVDLEEFRRKHRMQQLVFECAQRLTREYCAQPGATIAPHTLFPQLVPVVERYLSDRVEVLHGGDRKDAFLSPYFGWLIETLREHIRPDQAQGEAPEIPRYEENRMEGSTADVDTWTSKDVREVTRSHVNFVIADTQQWEQAAAFILDTHARVEAFVKNAGLGFGIPYRHNGQMHDYVPDFLVRLKDVPDTTIILETKGFDPLAEVKASAAARWVSAVNAEGSHGRWQYELARSVSSVGEKIAAIHQ
jgi:type III restriction enzyme